VSSLLGASFQKKRRRRRREDYAIAGRQLDAQGINSLDNQLLSSEW
jgi:hypothetical protein